MKLVTATVLAVLLAGWITPSYADVASQQDLRRYAQTLQDNWSRFKQLYVKPDGRVVDTGNKGISHSEGQGYAMLVAASLGDHRTFQPMLRWTQNTLQRSDGLHAWRYNPASRPAVDDPGSASDAELLIAWALLRAERRWPGHNYEARALRILGALRKSLVTHLGQKLVLMPWEGAQAADPVVINPSYFVFPALQDIAVYTQDDFWVALYEDSMDIVQAARFGRYALPPDWLALGPTGRFSTWSERPARFGYDAIRIPLYLAWAGHRSDAFLGRFDGFWGQFPAKVPAWVELNNSSRPKYAKYEYHKGFASVRRFAMHMYQGHKLGGPPRVEGGGDYYSNILLLLSQLAAREQA